MQRRGLSTTQLLNAMTTDYTIPSRPSTSTQEELIPHQSLTPLRKKQDQNQALHRYTKFAKSCECEAPLLLMHPWCCGGKGKCAASGASIASHVKHNCEECRAAKSTNRAERRALTKLQYQARKVRCEAPSTQPLIFCFKL